MAGWRLVNNLVLGLVAWFALAGAPAAAVPQGQPAPTVAVILSDSEAAYSLPLKTFQAEVAVPVRVFSLRGDIDRAPALMTEVLSLQPSLILALGAKAAFAAKIWTRDRPDLPVLFAMVLNWQRYGLMDGQENIFGIDSEMEPGIQFAHLLTLSPDVKRIGVVYNSDFSSTAMVKARENARILGVQLVERVIRHPHQLERAYLEISQQIDALLIPADPVVYTLENVAWLEKRCIRDRLICIGQSRNAARLGILMAVDPDIPNIGAQAASLTRSIVAGKLRPSDIGVMQPLGTKIYLNLRTAEKVGLRPSRAAVNMATEVYDSH
jgi:ABC-type uncharacterized transport system substrate-binding protein